MSAPRKQNPPGGNSGGPLMTKGLENPSFVNYRKQVALATIADETAVHITVYEYLVTVLPPSYRIAHIPNGGKRDIGTARKLKRMGTMPGLPDFVMIGRGGWCGFLEVKRPKRGKLSPDQKDFRDWAISNAIPFAVVTGIDDARAVLAHWKIETREARR